jgi:hypothetical protein
MEWLRGSYIWEVLPAIQFRILGGMLPAIEFRILRGMLPAIEFRILRGILSAIEFRIFLGGGECFLSFSSKFFCLSVLSIKDCRLKEDFGIHGFLCSCDV